MTSSSPILRRFSFAALAALAALTLVHPSPLLAAPHGKARPVFTPEQARALLSLSGANVGTVRRLDGIGRVRIDDISVSAEGRWLVIRVLPSILN